MFSGVHSIWILCWGSCYSTGMFMMCLSTHIFWVEKWWGGHILLSDLVSVSHIPVGYCEYLCMADIRGNVIDSGI